MFETLAILPVAFWVVIALLVGGAVWAVALVREGVGFPILAVLGTAAAWYVGDALYNDYPNNHARLFTSGVLEAAWWQVAWFLLVFLFLTPVMHRWFNARQLNHSSQIVNLLRTGVGQPLFQSQLNQMFWGCVTVWLILVVIALYRLGNQIPYYFFPFLGYKADPWGRGQIGGGFDSLLSLAAYFQMFVAAIFGVTAALAQNSRVRALALAGCVLTWPGYLFDRTRNYMLVVVMPGILAWVFLRLRVGLFQKALLLAGCYFLVSTWFAFVIANRSDVAIAQAFNGEGVSIKDARDSHHAGLNMFEELCWANTFIENGVYKPNWGARYFAELVNPIPRVLWRGKPMIGLDYAVARGQQYTENGTTATISTGMIGQGVVNFGRVLGPAFAAWLMSMWAAVLAGLDLRGDQLGRIPLFALGIILTFNLGRDITLITLYTFAFGSLVVWWVVRSNRHSGPRGFRRTGPGSPQNQQKWRVPSEPLHTPPEDLVADGDPLSP
jgi:hypothetical protein